MTDLPFPQTLVLAAARAVCNGIKGRARLYAKRPATLEALYPGLASASATTLVAVASHLVEREERNPRRWFGFGGEVTLLDARAALLLGRVRRRAEARAHSLAIANPCPT